jgi:hypothetical protein
LKRIGYAASIGIAGCQIVFGLEEPTLGEPSAQTGTGAATAGSGGGTAGNGSGGAPLPCTEVPCVVWSRSLGETDAGDVTPGALAVHADGSILLGGSYAGTIDFAGEVFAARGTDGFVALLQAGGAPLGLQPLADTARPNSAAGAGPQWVVGGTNNGRAGLPNNCNAATNGASFFIMLMDSMGMCSASFVHSGGTGTSAVVSARGSDVWFAGKTFNNVNLGSSCVVTSNGGAADLFVANADAALTCNNMTALVDAGNATLVSASWPALNAVPPHPHRVLTFWGSDSFPFGTETVDGGPGTGVLALFDNVDGTALVAAEFRVTPDTGLRAFRSAQSPNDGSIWALLAFTGYASYNVNAAGGPDYDVSALDVDTVLFLYDGQGGYIGPEAPPAIGGMGEQRGESIAVDSQGNVYVAGWFDGEINLGSGFVPSNGLRDAFVLEFSPAGILTWGVRWGDANDQAATHIAVTADDHVIVAGTYEGVIDFGPVQYESVGATSTFVVELSPELP